MSGFVTVVVNACNSIGSVLCSPMVWLERAISSHESVKPNRPTPITEGATIGKTIENREHHQKAKRQRPGQMGAQTRREFAQAGLEAVRKPGGSVILDEIV